MKRWMMAMVVIGVLLAAGSWPGAVSGAGEKIVPTGLAEKSALYNAKTRWGEEVCIHDMQTYVDLSGQPAAYVYTIQKKAGEAPRGSALRARIGEARGKLRESQAELDRLNRELRNKGKRRAELPPPAEAEGSAAPADAELIPVSAVLSEDFVAAIQQPLGGKNAMEKKLESRRLARQKVHQLRRELFQMDLFGTVVVGAHFGTMPFLEMFDGLALHHTMQEAADQLAANTLGAENVERGAFIYLGPTFFVFEHVQNGRRVLTDPTTGQCMDKEVVRSGRSATPAAPKADPAAEWRFIADYVDDSGNLLAAAPSGDTPSGGATVAIGGVPFYHQDDYGTYSDGPTASAMVLGYWDDHGFGNLIDNGRSNTGHEWQLVYDLMEAQGYDPALGVSNLYDIGYGIIAVAGYHKYGNNMDAIAYSADFSIEWSDITGQIDAGRPFVYYNWVTSSYPNWKHYTTGVGYEHGILHVHNTYTPDTDYIINWLAVPDDNQAMVRIYPGTPYVTIMSEDFEPYTEFSWWERWSRGTEAYWGVHTYRPHAGYNPAPCPPPSGNSGRSAYCAFGGSAWVSPPGPYPGNMEGWAVYGPFSLKNILGDARLEFYRWYKAEWEHDYFAVMASADGLYFSGWQASGDSGGWQQASLDLSPYGGDDSVWVAFRFTSDYATGDEGAYVDDVTIRKLTGLGDRTRVYLGDFDQNMRSDLGLFTPSGVWNVKNTRGSSLVLNYAYGQAGDIPVMGDYDGDGDMDVALFRPSTGVWYARNYAGLNLPGFPYCFGKAGDIPVPGDYDGDGRTDIALFRPSTGVWYAKSYATGSWLNIAGFPYCFGKAGDIPVPAPYSFTGKTDIGMWRPSTGNWYVRKYSAGAWSNLAGFPLTYGVAGDRPVPGDYDGDGVTDIGIFRPANGKWYAKWRFMGVWGTLFSGVPWGQSGDIPVPLDYDGDGATELAVWRPSTAGWLIAKPDLTVLVNDYRFGESTDKPLGYNSGVAFLFF